MPASAQYRLGKKEKVEWMLSICAPLLAFGSVPTSETATKMEMRDLDMGEFGGSLRQNVEEDCEDNVEPGWKRLLVCIHP